MSIYFSELKVLTKFRDIEKRISEINLLEKR